MEKAKLLCSTFINNQFNYTTMVIEKYMQIENIHLTVLKMVFNRCILQWFSSMESRGIYSQRTFKTSSWLLI